MADFTTENECTNQDAFWVCKQGKKYQKCRKSGRWEEYSCSVWK